MGSQSNFNQSWETFIDWIIPEYKANWIIHNSSEWIWTHLWVAVHPLWKLTLSHAWLGFIELVAAFTSLACQSSKAPLIESPIYTIVHSKLVYETDTPRLSSRIIMVYPYVGGLNLSSTSVDNYLLPLGGHNWVSLSLHKFLNRSFQGLH